MQFFDRAFKEISRSLSAMKKSRNIYICSLNSSDDILLNKSNEISSGHICCKDNSKVNTAFMDSISIIPTYSSSVGEVAGELRTRIDVLSLIALKLNYFSFAEKNGGVYISTLSNSDADIKSEYQQLDNLFKKFFNCGITLSKATGDECFSILEQRIKNTHTFYVEEQGAWTERFMARLGDELSRESFKVFLRQRIRASVFYDRPVCYPVLPPAKTAAWRRMRENKSYEFPVLHGASTEILNRIFYKYIYVYEQYAIQGVVEAQPGDTVADVGAFIGDTACYFSRKVGKSGKVLAFEIAPDSILVAKENMKINKCDNVEIVPYALSDKSGYLSLSLLPGDASSNSIIMSDNCITDSDNKIKVITLDEYCEQNKEKINFIKADIEGSEMSMLRGGQHTIQKNAPICAICLYHKKNDFWEIPQYLEQLIPEYTFYFRCEAEPVLFTKLVR